MGYKELIDALRKEGEEKVCKVWKEAEAEAQKIREESLKRIGEMRDEYNSIHSSIIKDRAESILSEAENTARTIRLQAEKRLSDRIYNLAVKSLYILRDDKYRDVFDALVKELPHYKWKVIRVNPEDKGIAKKCFQDSEILPDINIIGGVDVMENDIGIRIINTFEKRLERVWTEMLPELIKEIHCKFSN